MPISFPSIPPDSMEISIESNTQYFESPFNFKSQVSKLSGDRLRARLTYNRLEGADARRLRAFLASLQGRFNSFYCPIFEQPSLEGRGTGTPLVKGAAQTGYTLMTDGWEQSITGILLAGDYIQIGTEVKLVTADVDSDSGGNASISVTPAIRTAPADNSAIVLAYPQFIARLANDDTSWQITAPVIIGLSIDCVEVT